MKTCTQIQREPDRASASDTLFARSKNRALKHTAVDTSLRSTQTNHAARLARAANEVTASCEDGESEAGANRGASRGTMGWATNHERPVLRGSEVRRLYAAIRAVSFLRHASARTQPDRKLFAVTTDLPNDETAVIGFLGHDIVVNDLRLGKFSAQLVDGAHMHERTNRENRIPAGQQPRDLSHLLS